MIIMDPKDLVSRAPFSTLFPIRADTKDAIVQSMREKGFDTSQPIHVWRQGNIIIDGHTRAQCAIEAGVEVTIFYHDFKDDDEALDYAIAMQRNRRNLNDAELLSLISVVDRKRKPCRSQPAGTANGDSAPETASKVGTSATKVRNSRIVLTDPEETDQVLHHGKTIAEAARTVISKGGGARKALLDQAEARQGRVKAYIDANPGVAIRAAAKELGINRQTLRQDLVALELKPPPPSRATRGKSKPKPKPQNGQPTHASFATRAEAVEWTSTFKIREQIDESARVSFDDDAIIARELIPRMKEVEQIINRLFGQGRTRIGMGSLQKALQRFMSLSDPSCWHVCTKCNGDGTGDRKGQDGTCAACKSYGYVIPMFTHPSY